MSIGLQQFQGLSLDSLKNLDFTTRQHSMNTANINSHLLGNYPFGVIFHKWNDSVNIFYVATVIRHHLFEIFDMMFLIITG